MPDEAVVHLAVITEAATAAEAVQRNADQTKAVIDAVSEQPNHGVATRGLSVSPIMSYEPTTGEGKVVGFRATNGVDVTTKIDYVGGIYDAGIAAGANQSSGITFRVSNQGPYREEALRLAVEQAFKEARIVAGAANLELKAVEAIQVDPADGIIFYRSEAFDAKMQATPVIPEPQTITGRVQVQFRTREHLEAHAGKGAGDKRAPTAHSRGSA
jgi:uncharacterized protein YggE